MWRGINKASDGHNGCWDCASLILGEENFFTCTRDSWCRLVKAQSFHYYMEVQTVRVYTDAEELKGWTVPVSKLLPPKHPIYCVCPALWTGARHLNSFPLPAGTVLGFVNRGPGRDTARHCRGETSPSVSCVISPVAVAAGAWVRPSVTHPHVSYWDLNGKILAITQQVASCTPAPAHGNPENSTGTPADGFLWANASLTPQQTHPPEGCSHTLSSEV